MSIIRVPKRKHLFEMAMLRLREAEIRAKDGSASFVYQNFGEAQAYAQILLEMYNIDLTTTEVWDDIEMYINKSLNERGYEVL